MIPHRGRGRIKGWKKKPVQTLVSPQSVSAGESEAATADAGLTAEDAVVERASESEGEEHAQHAMNSEGGPSPGAFKLEVISLTVSFRELIFYYYVNLR